MNRDDEIFGAALELPPDERAAFLARSCGEDGELRARVEALLKGFDRAGEFLERPAADGLVRPRDEQLGDSIGRYTLVKKVGEGGCGTVYLAEQKVPVRRRVALKIIKLGMDTRQVIARFEGERQALAMMDHPDIAHVVDAGATETGRPYFVMEFVDGVPVDRYCDDHRLPVAARLEVFARVCVALHHAHQKGIVHRDVKPSNILVAERDGAPAPKVIDFGVAKAMQEKLTEQTLLTGVDQFIGTPAYMSPEQADLRDMDIDTRSDVYSLGVLLYQLLVGRLPFDAAALREAGVDQLRRLIREVEPARPSVRFAALPESEREAEAARRATTVSALTAALRDDLDWIAVRCLEKDRERRYASAQELADDIRRHLRHEPVAARPPTTLYRARRFVARHRVACASAAAIALTLIAGTVVSVRQAVRATHAERIATAERDTANAASRVAAQAKADAQRRQEQAEDLLTFMLGNFRAELQNTRVEALDAVDNKAMAYFAALDPRDLNDTVLTRQAKALYQIGATRMDEARYAEAADAFAASYDRAAALVARHPQDGDMLFERAQAEYWRAFVARRRGDFAGTREWFTRYRESAIALVALEGTKLRAQHELAYGYHNLAALDMDQGNLVEAQRGFLAERAALETMLAANPDNVELRWSVADVVSWLGSVAEADGRYAEAFGLFSECMSRFEELGKLQPKVSRWRQYLAEASAHSAELLAITNRRAEAYAAYARTKALRDGLIAQDVKNRQWQYAALHGRLREIAVRCGEDDGLQYQAEVGEIRLALEGLVKAESSSSVFTAALAAAWRLEAQLRLAAKQADAADAVEHSLLLGESLVSGARADRKIIGEFAQSCLLAGRVALAAGRVDAATRHWERALAVLGPRFANSKDWLFLDPAAQALVLLGRRDEARSLCERLQRYGYHSPDPLAASLLDSVVVPPSSTSSP